MTLNDLKDMTQRTFRIGSLTGPRDVVERLEEMGFFPGADIEVERRLPLSGPWIVHVGASSFALRSEEASSLVLTERNEAGLKEAK